MFLSLHNAWFLACWLASSMYVLLAGCVASHSKQSILPCLYSKATDNSPLLFERGLMDYPVRVILIMLSIVLELL